MAEAKTRWAARLRVAFGVCAFVTLLFCLIGIMLTGPIVVRVPQREIVTAVDPGRMEQTVRRLCVDLAPRDYRHRQNLDRAAEWIAGRLRQSGLDVEFQHYDLDEGRFTNVVAHRPGSDPDAGVIVVGAHYDAYGGFPGADDNASGVAVLLELALTLPRAAPREGLYLVAFSTEEPPFFGGDEMGSYVFAKKLRDDDVRVSLMIALDLVGYYSDEPGSQDFPYPGLGLLYPTTGDFVAVIGDLGAGDAIRRVKRGMRSTRTIDVHSFRAPVMLAPVWLSDHSSFRRLQMPAVQVTDTAFMRNPHYHTSQDTPERLDYRRMADVVRALHGVLWDPEQDRR